MPKTKSKSIKTLPVAKNMIAVPISSMATDSPEISSDSKARQMKWKAEDALRDIERAESHKSDRELMKHVKSLAKEKVASLKKIC